MAKKKANKKNTKKVATKKSKPVKKAKKEVKKSATKKAVKKPVKKVVKTKKAAPAKKNSAKKTIQKTAKKVLKKVSKVQTKAKRKQKTTKPSSKAVKNTKIAKREATKPVIAKKPEPQKPIIQKLAAASKPANVTKKSQSQEITYMPGIVKKDEFVLDKRPLSELKINMNKPLIKRIDGPAPVPHIGKDNRTRYSDKELQEFKAIILKKLEEAKKDYELLKSTLSHKDDHGTDDTSPTFKLLEDGSDVLSKEETAQLALRQEKFIQNLQNALVRIENKSYGICRVTGKLIPKERLRRVPHATLAIEAKLEQSR